MKLTAENAEIAESQNNNCFNSAPSAFSAVNPRKISERFRE